MYAHPNMNTLSVAYLRNGGLILLSALLLGCSRTDRLPPEMEQLPQELTPFARKLAAARLPYVAVTPVEEGTTLRNSKLLGVPYYPKDRPWPRDPEGKPLVMLAQINFAEMPVLDGYPSGGILQIYISPGANDTEIWGMRIDAAHQREIDRLTDQGYFRVIYFPDASLSDQYLIREVPDYFIDDDYGFPIAEEARLQFQPRFGYVLPDDYRFRRVFGANRDDFFDRRLGGLEERYTRFIGGDRYHGRIGGYSRDAQTDPRLEFAAEDWLVLFSLDSFSTGRYAVDWGGDGVANFYIRPQDLAKRDFSRVMYEWNF
jgi:uncharacterized protein YwqG